MTQPRRTQGKTQRQKQRQRQSVQMGIAEKTFQPLSLIKMAVFQILLKHGQTNGPTVPVRLRNAHVCEGGV